MALSNQTIVDYGTLTDLELAARCIARERTAIQHVITNNNQRLFRAAWSILKSHSDAEDAVQAAYLSGFAKMASFEGRSSLATWLTRIVVNEALKRRQTEQSRRAQLDRTGVAVLDDYREALMRGSETEQPDISAARAQIRKLLEQAVAELPDGIRTTFVLRDIEGMAVDETAEALGIPAATVKTRLFRARRKLQELLAPEVKAMLGGSYPFAGRDCAALTRRVLVSLGLKI